MILNRLTSPKRREWIQDYFLQLAAYGMAHNHVYKTEIQGGVILMCSPELVFQRFFVTPKEYQVLQWEWLKGLIYITKCRVQVSGAENL